MANFPKGPQLPYCLLACLAVKTVDRSANNANNLLLQIDHGLSNLCVTSRLLSVVRSRPAVHIALAFVFNLLHDGPQLLCCSLMRLGHDIMFTRWP